MRLVREEVLTTKASSHEAADLQANTHQEAKPGNPLHTSSLWATIGKRRVTSQASAYEANTLPT